ncbi:hypothetical protein CIHG_08312 [Coccidioides immitis H538.4]|uniref:Uncharacterized protein n=1 Tax=Coccidioides immitis H538.4 TaxID=396776 RepID=A0A0J8S1A0_COCIT|nr:hypothetical protein CIHG_08312 [Coccidioides immitis H538.4]
MRKIRIPNPLTSIPILFHKNSLAIILVGSIYYTVSRTLGASLSAQCIEIYDLNYLEAGLVYLPTGLAGMISSYSTAKLGRDTNLRAGEDNDDFPVEKTRLRSVWYLIIISSAATLGYGWALYKRAVIVLQHIAVPLVMQFLSGLSITSIFTICGTLLTDLNSNKSSTAQAAYNLVRCVGAGGGVAALQPIINGVGLGWGFTLYAFFCLTSVPVLWILQTKGREKHRFIRNIFSSYLLPESFGNRVVPYEWHTTLPVIFSRIEAGGNIVRIERDFLARTDIHHRWLRDACAKGSARKKSSGGHASSN